MPNREQLARQRHRLRAGERIDLDELTAWLVTHGYQRMEAVEIPGEFSRRGGILDVFSPDAEVPDLKKIAGRSGQPGLAFASDEDARGIDPDPHSVRFDLGNDLVEYAKLQAKLVSESLPHVVADMTKDGDGETRTPAQRRASKTTRRRAARSGRPTAA